jgi:hypothetical protein
MADEILTPGQDTTTDPGTGAAPPPNAAPSFTPEQQTLIDSLIGDRLKRARSKWDEERAAAQKKADAQAEAERLQAQQEWQTLAEKHQARVTELEPLVGQVEQYASVIAELLDTQVKALGPEAQTAIDALPGQPSPLDKLQWLTANEGLFKRTTLPPTDGQTRGTTEEPQVSDEDVAEFAARTGVDPRYVDRRVLAASKKVGG